METSEPVAATAGGRGCVPETECVTAAGLSSAGPAALDAARLSLHRRDASTGSYQRRRESRQLEESRPVRLV